MKKLAIIIFSCFVFFSSFAQVAIDPVVLSYKRNFVRASLLTKIELLEDAGKVKNVSMSPLYFDALKFVSENYPLLENDTSLKKLAVLAINLSADINATENLESIWSVFSMYSDLNVKKTVISACAKLGKGNKTVTDAINSFLTSQLSSFESGSVIDRDLFKEGIAALGKIGSETSFDILFKTIMSSIDEETKQISFSSLVSLDGDLKANLSALIAQGTDEQKLAGFRMAMKYEALDDVTCGELAEEALNKALEANSSGKESKSMFDLRYEAISVITDVKWVKAVPLAIKHFYLAQNEFRKGSASIVQFTNAIKCLGAMGSADCAQSLSIYLGLLNSEMEQTKNYNEQIMLAIIQSLGALGDKVSFDYLLYVSYLDYPETIKNASRDSLERLKW